jgi:hypothetical protein
VLRTLLSTTVLMTVVCPPGKVDVNTLVAVMVDACWGELVVGVSGITSTVLVLTSLPGSVDNVVNEDGEGEGSKLVDSGNVVVVMECEDESGSGVVVEVLETKVLEVETEVEIFKDVIGIGTSGVEIEDGVEERPLKHDKDQSSAQRIGKGGTYGIDDVVEEFPVGIMVEENEDGKGKTENEVDKLLVKLNGVEDVEDDDGSVVTEDCDVESCPVVAVDWLKP